MEPARSTIKYFELCSKSILTISKASGRLSAWTSTSPRRQGPGNGRHPHPGGDPHDPQGTRRGRLGNPDVASGTAQEEQRYEIFARTDRPRDRKAAGQTRDFRRRLHGRKSGRNSPEPQTRRGDAARKPAFLRRGGGQARGLAEDASEEEKAAAKKRSKPRRKSSSSGWLRMPTATSTTLSAPRTAHTPRQP